MKMRHQRKRQPKYLVSAVFFKEGYGDCVRVRLNRHWIQTGTNRKAKQ